MTRPDSILTIPRFMRHKPSIFVFVSEFVFVFASASETHADGAPVVDGEPEIAAVAHVSQRPWPCMRAGFDPE